MSGGFAYRSRAEGTSLCDNVLCDVTADAKKTNCFFKCGSATKRFWENKGFPMSMSVKMIDSRFILLYYFAVDDSQVTELSLPPLWSAGQSP